MASKAQKPGFSFGLGRRAAKPEPTEEPGAGEVSEAGDFLADQAGGASNLAALKTAGDEGLDSEQEDDVFEVGFIGFLLLIEPFSCSLVAT